MYRIIKKKKKKKKIIKNQFVLISEKCIKMHMSGRNFVSSYQQFHVSLNMS